MIFRSILTKFVFWVTIFSVSAQITEVIPLQIEWSNENLTQTINIENDQPQVEFTTYNFRGAVYPSGRPYLPLYLHVMNTPFRASVNISLENAVYEEFAIDLMADNKGISETILFKDISGRAGTKYKTQITFVPMINDNGVYKRLVSGNLVLNLRRIETPNALSQARTTYPNTSVLADANQNSVYKIPINSVGIHKLDANYLENLGINLSELNPKHLKIFGNGGGALKESIDAIRFNDLIENPILVTGEEDGSFDTNDAIIFFAEGPHDWYFDNGTDLFLRQTNIYSNNNFYYLKIDDNNGLRVHQTMAPNSDNFEGTTSSYDAYRHFEEDKFNLLDSYFAVNLGSGQDWYGDSYKLVREQIYNNVFDFDNIKAEPATILLNFASRTETSNTKLNISVGDYNFTSESLGTISTSSLNNTYAKNNFISSQFIPNSGSLDLRLNYPNIGNNEGWFDFATVNARCDLKLPTSKQLLFRDKKSLNYPSYQYKITASENVIIWDITNPINPRLQSAEYLLDRFEFATTSDAGLKEFVAFDPSASLIVPQAASRVDAQNLHNIRDVDMLVVYHSTFKDVVNRYVEHRSQNRGIEIATAEIEDIFNEFSSGKYDPSAIREMAKMLFERNPDRFKYLLLFGDATFDPRNIKNHSSTTNFVPLYETKNSLDPILAFPSDDYFGLLTEGEGTTTLSGGFLDIAVGRFPFSSVSQANEIVDKLINYDNSKDAFGDWRNRVIYVADNGDSNTHLSQSDGNAETLRSNNPNYNINKIYLDSYELVSTTGDARVPDATEALNRSIFRGALALIYLGHGGPNGWAQERVLLKDDIFGWDNKYKLPLFITATCSFTSFDNDISVSAGEEVFLNPQGGSMGLYSTVRAVYSGANAALTNYATQIMFNDTIARDLSIGEILMQSKNNNSSSSSANQRKFLLIGDPSQLLAIPKNKIVTTKINGNEIDAMTIDTLSALDQVTIEGSVTDNNGNLLSDFNGIVYPTVYDKIKEYTTRGEIASSPAKPYLLRDRVLFKGRASVSNGRFEFNFVLPKDTDFNFGTGKISYYAEDKNQYLDASGYNKDIIVGGVNNEALLDDQGPEVEVLLNNFEWISGGITDPKPTLLVKLYDQNGINVVGNSIGHDLTAVLDQDTRQSFNLNEYYESELDNFRRGLVRFPMTTIPAGVHEITVTAWDVANNNAKGSTEFIVAESGELALDRILNYPNPFVNSTCFMFDVTELGPIDAIVSIYTISGRLVKTISANLGPVQGRVGLDNCIHWDGNDNFGDPLARGVYLYKIAVRNPSTGQITDTGKTNNFEKLVIIR